MAIIEKIDNVCNCICDGSCYLLVYRDSNKEYIFHGQHGGQITGKSITIEHFSSEEELNTRMVELEIVIPEDLIESI